LKETRIHSRDVCEAWLWPGAYSPVNIPKSPNLATRSRLESASSMRLVQFRKSSTLIYVIARCPWMRRFASSALAVGSSRVQITTPLRLCRLCSPSYESYPERICVTVCGVASKTASIARRFVMWKVRLNLPRANLLPLTTFSNLRKLPPAILSMRSCTVS